MYNGFGRLDQASPNQLLDKSIRLGLPPSPPPGWDRLLTGQLGRDTGWLLAAALVALIAGLAARRRRPRGDLVRACAVLWGAWLAVLTVVFSLSSAINSYYTAALSPAVAALIGTGLTLAWENRKQARARLALGVALLATAGYAVWLLPAAGPACRLAEARADRPRAGRRMLPGRADLAAVWELLTAVSVPLPSWRH